MARKVSGRMKRSLYVSKNPQEFVKEMDLTDSNDDLEEAPPPRKKVRHGLSVRELKRDSEYFQADEDHIYSKATEGEKVKSCRDEAVYLTRSHTLKRSQSESSARNYGDDAMENTLVTGKRERCASKNAVMARLNREKKKQYISSLENTKNHLLKQNDEILQKVGKQEKIIAALQYEVKYLKSLLANSKEISDILKSLKKSTGLPVSSSLKSLVSEECDTLDNNIDPGDINHGVLSESSIDSRQPYVKTVTCGRNFPILQEDVNLGYFDATVKDDLMNQVIEETDLSICGESDFSLDSICLNDIDSDLNPFMLDHHYNSSFISEYEDIYDMDKLLKANIPEGVNNFESEVGLCLHVNKKMISVELCPLCNTRAHIK